MFGIGPPGTVTRKPRGEWFFEDNGITGIMASKYRGALPDVILPRGLTDEQRDLVMWAYETGHLHGQHAGRSTLQDEIKCALNL